MALLDGVWSDCDMAAAGLTPERDPGSGNGVLPLPFEVEAAAAAREAVLMHIRRSKMLTQEHGRIRSHQWLYGEI